MFKKNSKLRKTPIVSRFYDNTLKTVGVAEWQPQKVKFGVEKTIDQKFDVWPAIIPGQDLPLNPVSFTRIERYSNAGIARYPLDKRYTVDYHIPEGGYCTLPLVYGIGTSALTVTQAQIDLSYVMAKSRINDILFDAGIGLAELPETIMMMRHPLSSLSSLLVRWTKSTKILYDLGVRSSTTRYRSRRLRKRDFAEAAANTWLVARYGIVPVLSDLDTLSKQATLKMSQLHSQLHSAHGANTREVFTAPGTSSSFFEFAGASTPPKRSTRTEKWDKLTVSHCIRYRFRPEMHAAAKLAAYGLSPTQLGSLLYEATPFSFCVDWVTNLGQWIKAMEPRPHIVIKDVCRTDKWFVLANFEDVGGSYSYYTNALPAGIRGYVKIDNMVRTEVTNSIVPPLPRLRENGFKLLQSLDSLALITNPLLKRLSKWL